MPWKHLLFLSNFYNKFNWLWLQPDWSQGAKAIAEMLKKNEQITHLELNNNVIDYAVTDANYCSHSFTKNDMFLHMVCDGS